MPKLQTSRALAVSFGAQVEACIGGLAQQYGVAVLQAGSADVVFDSIRRIRPSLLVLGMQQPESEATRLIRLVTGMFPSIPVAVIATRPDEEVERAALQAGARYYLACSSGCCYREALESILSRHDAL